MNKSFEFISISKAMQVAAVRNGQVADALVARIEVGDLFNDTHFYLEVGLETKENAEATLRQKVENCQTMEELIGGFNQQLRELGVYCNDANRLPEAYFVETRVAQALNLPRTKLESIEYFDLPSDCEDIDMLDSFHVYYYQGKCGVVTQDGVVTPPVFEEIWPNDEFLLGVLEGNEYFVVPDDQLIDFYGDEPEAAIRVSLPDNEYQDWIDGIIY